MKGNKQDMISAKHSSVLKYGDISFPNFILVRKPVKEPKVHSDHQLPELEKHMYSFKNVIIVECAEQDSERICVVA